MRPYGDEPSLRETLASGWPELALYVGAGIAYVAIGVAIVEFLFSGLVAVVFLLLCVVVVPAVARRLRR